MHILQCRGVGGVQKLVYNIVFQIACPEKIVIFTYKDGDREYLKKFEDVNIQVHISPYGVNDFRNIFEIKKVVKLYAVDIIHVHNTTPQIFCSFAHYFANLNVKLVVTEHSITSKRRKFKILRVLDNVIYSSYSKIVSVSEPVNFTVRQWLRYIDERKFIVIQNGIEVSKYLNAEPLSRGDFGLADSDFVILSVGRLRESKGFCDIIKALKYLPHNYKLLIVGDGPLKHKCLKLIVDLSLDDRVIMMGVRNDIPAIMKMSDLYVSASYTEGFGLTIIEAIASGLPVIGSDIDAFRELLCPNSLFPVRDHSRIAELIVNGKFCDYSGNIEKYSLKGMTDKYIDLYNSLT